jgi:branched-chain amino acid aminotransferase
LLPAKLAGEKGYQQILWTDSKEHKYFEESGTMNVMFQIDGKLITPPLSTSILAGITRDSILTVARSWGVPVEERKVSIEEIISALKDGRLEDAFGTGTAAVITHIDAIHYDGKDYELPGGEKRSLSEKIANELTEIKLGHTNDQFDWVYKIKL